MASASGTNCITYIEAKIGNIMNDLYQRSGEQCFFRWMKKNNIIGESFWEYAKIKKTRNDVVLAPLPVRTHNGKYTLSYAVIPHDLAMKILHFGYIPSGGANEMEQR